MSIEVTETTNSISVDGDIGHSIEVVESPSHLLTINEQAPNELLIQEQPATTLQITTIPHTIELSEEQYILTIEEGGGGSAGPLSNYTATTDPTATDDSSLGYTVGSIWVNTTTDEPFILVDSAVGAAVWQSMLGGGGGGGEDYLFSVDGAVPNSGQRYLDVGGVNTASVPVVVPVAATVREASISVDSADATNSYDLEIFVNGTTSTTLVSLASTDSRESASGLSVSLLADDYYSIRLTRTSGSGRSDFREVVALLKMEEV